MVRLRLFGVFILVGVLAAGAAFAQTSKLNARARIALAQLEAGAVHTGASMESFNAQGELDVFITGSVSRATLEALGVRVRTELPGIMTAYIPTTVVDAVAALPGVTTIQGAAPVDLELDASVPTTGAIALRGAGPNFTGLNGQGVILGDVDSGFDFEHGDFRDALNQTRFLNIWDQTVNTGPNPAGFGYGTEWFPVNMNPPYTATQTDVNGHGTHVMGIQGGDGSQTGGAVPAHTYVGMAPMADLIGVKSSLLTSQIVDGANYVFGKATLAGKNAVLNLSLGSHYGPHDGTSGFESALDALTGPGRIIVKSAGNERGQARHMEVFAAGAGTSATLSFSGSAAGRILAFDGYYEATENMNVQITTPDGTIIGPVALGGVSAAFPGTVTANGRVYLENGLFLTATGDREVYLEISIQNPNLVNPQNWNGTWTITFIPVALGAANGEVDMWRFFNSTSAVGNWVIGLQEEELVSEPGNAPSLITTAAWVSKQTWTDCRGVPGIGFGGTPPVGNLAQFSSMGPTRDGRQKPDIAAPGIAIGSTRSFDIAIACPAGASTNLNDGINHVINAGTSMAAPHTSGACALIMQKYGAMTPAQIKTFLNARAVVDGFTGGVWNKDWGNGKLHLGDMLDPTVAVVAPNGGEVFVAGSPISYQWNANDNVLVTTVDLYLSRDGGTNYTLIAAGVPNSGSYGSTATLPASTQCRLKVVANDAAANSAEDVSDLDWSIIDGPTPTLMSMMAADVSSDGVSLRWQFGSEAAFANVVVERSTEAAGVYQVLDARATVESGVSTLVDRSVAAGTTYWYRIVGLSGTGARTVFGPISATAGQRITALALSRITPNPTTASARVDFALPTAGHVKVSIHDLQGREITRLVDGDYQAGVWQAMWNGRTERGDAPAGLYFVRLQAMGRVLSQRLIVSR
jgi:hypothetical protein